MEDKQDEKFVNNAPTPKDKVKKEDVEEEREATVPPEGQRKKAEDKSRP